MTTIPVCVLLPPRLLLLDVAGPLEVLRCDRVIETGTPDAAAGRESDAWQEQNIVGWLQRVVRPEHHLICVCSGALLAGRAGLLDGHACTTHHLCCAELKRLAPRAKVLENRLYVEDGRCCTSAGITTGIDLMLHLMARVIGHNHAVSIARYLVVYLRRSGNDPQLSPWLEGRNHTHPAVHRVQDAIAANPTGSWTVARLARICGVSPRHLSRLFLEHTGMGLVDYSNRLRIALAHELLSHTRLGMEHIAERAGFASSRQLRRVWRRVYKSAPREARAGRPFD